MKAWIIRLAVLALALCALAGCAAAERGDINGDGKADVTDAQVLRMYLVGDLDEINEADADFNFDGKVNMTDLVMLEHAVYRGEALPEEPEGDGRITRTDVVYGTSYKKRDLTCTIISPERYERTVLAVFALHGFEGAWDRDGQLLVYTANRLIEHFEAQNDMYGTRLMIVAAANPDGVWDGNSAEAFGYGNGRGIDLDADFSEAHKSSKQRGHYSRSPFSAPESAALRDLVKQYKPDIVLDFHGWGDDTIGDAWLSDVFKEEMSKSHSANFDTKTMAGTFMLWTHAQGCETLKVFLKTSEAEGDGIIAAMDRIVRHDYDDKEGDYELLPALADMGEYAAYADDYRRVRMYSDMNGRQIGYINATEDLCTIEAVYANGWLRVRYPIKEGWKVGYCPTENFFVPDTIIYPIRMQMPTEMRVFTKNKFLTDEYKQYSEWETVVRSGIRIHVTPKTTVDPNTQETKRVAATGQSMGGISKGKTVTVVAESDDAYQVIYPWKDEGYRMGWISNDKFDLPEIPRAADKPVVAQEETAEKVPEMELEPKTYTGTLSVEGLKINVGEEFDLPIFLDAKNISAMMLTVEFSPEVFDLLSVFDGGQLSGFTGSMDMESGVYRCLWNNQGDKAVNGLLVNLHFYTKPIGKDSQVRMSYKLRKGDALTDELDIVDVK